MIQPNIAPCDFIPKSSAVRPDTITATPPPPNDSIIKITHNIQGEVIGNNKNIIEIIRLIQKIKALRFPILSEIIPTTTVATVDVPIKMDNISAATAGEMPRSIAKGTICTVGVVRQKPTQNIVTDKSQNLLVRSASFRVNPVRCDDGFPVI